MGGHYDKGMYNQLVDVIEKMEALDHKVSDLTGELKNVEGKLERANKKISKLESENIQLKAENAELRSENNKLKEENKKLKDDNERMKRILNNDSSNSSNPPSSDGPTARKSANEYNGRVKTKKKAGAQKGHTGKNISKADIEDGIARGIYTHKIEEIGNKESGKWITKYRLDVETSVTATEIRIYADKNGKYNVPDELRGEVIYGNTVKALASYLYSEGVMSNDRICDFINALSGDRLNISTGSIYNFCREFSVVCKKLEPTIEDNLLNGDVIATDATVVTMNGSQNYIRNFSNSNFVLFVGAAKKNLETLRSFSVLAGFNGIFCHDHETAIYNFGCGHAECNVHLGRYLIKNTEETHNLWSKNLRSFLIELNEFRKRSIAQGITAFTDEQTARLEKRYDEIVALGRKQNKNTKGKLAKQDECRLLNRLEKYKDHHLLFLRNFSVPFSNNMSEKDLRICKNREKMSGGFRTDIGRDMYCSILSVIESLKRQRINLLRGIESIFNGQPIFA